MSNSNQGRTSITDYVCSVVFVLGEGPGMKSADFVLLLSLAGVCYAGLLSAEGFYC